MTDDNHDPLMDHFFKNDDQSEPVQVVQDLDKLEPIENADELIMIIDCSGSMNKILSDAQGGVNTFITDQKEADGEANITLVEFESTVDAPVYERIPINYAPDYRLRPRGMTALLDAIGVTLSRHREVETTGVRIAVIVTDGDENNSREWSTESVKTLITDMREEGWEFIFLAADEEQMQAGRSYGFDMNTSVQYDANVAGATRFAYTAASAFSTSLRGGMTKNLAINTMDEVVATAGDALKKQVNVDDVVDNK